ncbi:GDSL esterase/lipase At2g30220-like [Cornus florida]|uniref:GDSL esterase/lipase At2g30220-like n=1 Tax=Cornus florida TaxID=4283 RepID=UPI00289675F7|nr:GDSL esterase/lipase At2g30220-like [Cornus florida]
MAPTLLFILMQLCILILNPFQGTYAQKFPAILIFGDSILDTGNNNYINTVVKANFPPYGIDFPGNVATGRFSNGKLVSDFLAEMMEIKDTVPPFLNPNLSAEDLRTGVCFASAGSGFDELTTAESGVIPVLKQPEYLRSYIQKLKTVVGEEEARRIIHGSLVVLNAGTNDILISFYGNPTRGFSFSLNGYYDFLLTKLQTFVQELYELGCRKMVIAGLPPMSVPNQAADSQPYNQKLVSLLPRLQASLPGSKLVYGNIYDPLIDMVANPLKYGFVDVMRSCCGYGLRGTGPLCTPNTPVCPNPSQFMFWDIIHPTEAAYRPLAEAIKNIIETQIIGY